MRRDYGEVFWDCKVRVGEWGVGYSKAGVLRDVFGIFGTPLPLLVAISGLWVPVTQLVVLDVGGRLPQGLRSVLACSVGRGGLSSD